MTETNWIGSVLTAARPQAVAALLRYFRNLDTAEEAFQEACLRALKVCPKNGPPRDAAAWLIMVAKNAGIDSVRRTSRQDPLPPEEMISDLSDEAGGGNETAVVAATVLAAAVRVMDQTGRRPAQCNRALQRRQGQAPFHPVTHGPANDFAREQVDDDRQIQPALCRPHIRDINASFFIGSIRCKVLLENVRCHRSTVITIRRHLKARLLTGFHAVFAHQARHTVAAYRQAVFAKFHKHTRTAVGFIRS